MAAAVLTLALGISWWASQGQQTVTERSPTGTLFGQQQPFDNKWSNQVNGTSQPVTLSLPDGSQMALMPHSQAWYPRSFAADKREVYLKGDATFSVVHEGERPFLVYSGTLVTRVLGTRFRVQAHHDETQVVAVISGKVSVMDQTDWIGSRGSPNNAKAGVVLTANQQVTYDASHKSYQKELVARPVVMPSSSVNQESFTFEDTPAITVFERLKKAYGVEIIYDASVLRHCTLTASMAGVSMYDQLRLLCASMGASYEVVDTRIIISSKGCS